jgi:hypothetical protein
VDIISRGFTGRRQAGRAPGLLPPGQYDIGDPVPRPLCRAHAVDKMGGVGLARDW